MSGWVPKVGDRVMLRPDAGWNLPYRNFAEEGRGATIASVRQSGWDRVRIVFDVKRKGAKPRELWCDRRDVEHVEAVAQ